MNKIEKYLGESINEDMKDTYNRLAFIFKPVADEIETWSNSLRYASLRVKSGDTQMALKTLEENKKAITLLIKYVKNLEKWSKQQPINVTKDKSKLQKDFSGLKIGV